MVHPLVFLEPILEVEAAGLSAEDWYKNVIQASIQMLEEGFRPASPVLHTLDLKDGVQTWTTWYLHGFDQVDRTAVAPKLGKVFMLTFGVTSVVLHMEVWKTPAPGGVPLEEARATLPKDLKDHPESTTAHIFQWETPLVTELRWFDEKEGNVLTENSSFSMKTFIQFLPKDKTLTN